jgi:hypothetical protein
LTRGLSRRRTVALAGAAAAAAVLVALGLAFAFHPRRGHHEKAGREARHALRAGTPEKPSVVFVVIDMVRADRLSFCGYAKPTTPNLDAFARAPKTAATCLAYAPGTWTLSSHASYFTGEEVPVHGTDFMLRADQKGDLSLWGEPARPLAAGFETLAETFRARGYETVLVSGNPVVSRRAATGLARGFDVVRDATEFGALYGDALVGALRDALDEAGRTDKPTFLFINIADAHHPWTPIPPGLPWLPPRVALDNLPRHPETPYPRFLRGQMGPEERRRFLGHVGDSYDYAVSRTDRTFGQIVDLLRRDERFRGAARVAVTSDHGELLGEHELVGHGLFTYEGISRVPLMFWSSEGGVRIDATKPVSALAVHDLVARGAMPAKPRPVRAAGFPDGLLVELFGAERFSSAHAAAWDGSEKLAWSEAGYARVDLQADPGEERPEPLAADHPGRPALEKLVAAIRETERRKGEPSKEMIEALRALGYVQ